jgi:hypothetical protein
MFAQAQTILQAQSCLDRRFSYRPRGNLLNALRMIPFFLDNNVSPVYITGRVILCILAFAPACCWRFCLSEPPLGPGFTGSKSPEAIFVFRIVAKLNYLESALIEVHQNKALYLSLDSMFTQKPGGR